MGPTSSPATRRRMCPVATTRWNSASPPPATTRAARPGACQARRFDAPDLTPRSISEWRDLRAGRARRQESRRRQLRLRREPDADRAAHPRLDLGRVPIPPPLPSILVLRSSTGVPKARAVQAWRGRRPSPHPRLRTGVELCGRDRRRLVNLRWISETLASVGFSASQPPPRLLQVQPARPLGDEYLVHAGMISEPGLNRRALVTGEVVCDELECARRVGRGDLRHELPVA